MYSESIYIAIIIASIATYFCRSLGVISAAKLNTDNPIFNWVRCVSIGVIIAVISRIILYPVGVLEETSLIGRIIATFSLIIIYFISNKNLLLSVVLSTIIFIMFNFYFKIDF